MQQVDRLRNVTSYVARKSFEQEMNQCMEGYLADLDEMTVACEADVGASLKKAGEAIGAFVQKTIKRIMQLIDAIIGKVTEMLGSMHNLAHVKDVKAPKELVDSYQKMADEVESMSADTSSYVISIMEFQKKVERRNNVINLTEDPFFAEKTADRERTKKFIAKMEAMQKSDLLQGKSMDEYISNHKDEVPFKGSINPSAEQRRISKMRVIWTTLKRNMQTAASQLNSNFNYAMAFAKDQVTADSMNQYRIKLSLINNDAMQRVLCVLKVLTMLQHYITGFVQLAKKFGDLNGLVEPPVHFAGVLQEHN
jgi:hypothetical protein